MPTPPVTANANDAGTAGPDKNAVLGKLLSPLLANVPQKFQVCECSYWNLFLEPVVMYVLT